VPILPIALNSGLHWPRRSFLRRPGTIVVEILDPIAPGLDRDMAFRELQARLEAASGRLLVEWRRELGLDRSERALNRTTSSV
jgi:1-acyl-sn-glycerol-3-phosphate acyltransferase